MYCRKQKFIRKDEIWNKFLVQIFKYDILNFSETRGETQFILLGRLGKSPWQVSPSSILVSLSILGFTTFQMILAKIYIFLY